MTTYSSSILPICSSRFLPLVSILTIMTNGCTPAATARVPQSLASVPGIPNRPDLVTVVPFVWKDGENDLDRTRVPILAEIDGHRGLFILDMGAPSLCLNRTYLQPSPHGGVDTVSDATRLPDHTGPGNKPSEGEGVHVTVRLGTLINKFEDPALEALKPQPRQVNALLGHMWNNFSNDAMDGLPPLLGHISLSVLEPFETIIDYTHRRVVLIRLDNAGQRLVDVPAYTPKWSAPLVDIALTQYAAAGKDFEGLYWWGVQTLLHNVPISFFFDTGANDNSISILSRKQLRAGGGILDSLVIAGHTFAIGGNFGSFAFINYLGYPFMSQLGVVGFNHRTHKFILYH